MVVLFEILFVLFLIVLNGLFAMSELALVSARRARLAVLAHHGVHGAALARRLTEEPQSYLPTIQVGITLVGILTGVYGGAQLAEQWARWLASFPAIRPIAAPLAFVVVIIVITYLTLVVGELVPKQVALRHAEPIAVRVARPLAFLARLATPAVWLLAASTTLVLRLLRSPRARATPVSEEELKALVAEGQQAGVLEVEERQMIERVLRLADKKVRAIMTPRTEVAWLDRSDPPAELKATLKASPHSRFVVGDGSIDNVVGVVLVKELLNRLIDSQTLALTPLLRQAVVVPDTVSALDAMELLRADALGLALVMDEYGSFEGVVTAADLLAAIVGDAAGSLPSLAAGQPTAEGVLVFDGLLAVDELKARLVLPDLPARGSYNTLGGLVLALLRRVPETGDRIVFGGWRFEVIEMDGRRVARVQIAPEPVEPPAAETGAAGPS